MFIGAMEITAGRELQIQMEQDHPDQFLFRDFLELGSLVYIGEEKGKKILSQIPIAEASLVAVDALNAKLKAYVGGFDFSKSKFDRAANSKIVTRL